MDIKIGTLIKLSNSVEYIVISKAHHNDKEYFCLMNENNSTKLEFGYLDGNNMVFVDKKDIDAELYKKLYEEGKKGLDNLN